ncbi:MAG TPA: sensor domain-containing diguanylate cyclase [Mycobacteriales bacterium]|nr:sensor domain-containing diguanylate cyclase [Mycobacteriales bacterium]
MGRHSREGEPDTGSLVVGQSDSLVVGQSDEHFRALVELSPDAVFVIVDGYHAFANWRGLQLLGASKLSDLQSRPALDFMDESMRVEAEQRLAGMVSGANLEYVEETLIRLDGQAVQIEAAGRQISFGGRNGALVVARDITGRRSSEAQLRAAEEKFRAAFQNAPTGMAIVDRAGMFLDVNAALARLFGRRIATLHGDLFWHHLHPDDSERVRGDFDRVVDGTEDDVSGTFRYRTGAGGEGWVHASVSALVGQKSYIVHLVDVTQQKNTEYDLHRKATHDPLTGLPNRGLVLHKLGAALRSLRAEPGQVHVLFADLDGFKQVNDVHGHAVGDRVLRAAAERMRGALRPTDTIGRLGGDEFVVILKSLPHEVPAEEIAHRLAQAVAAPVAFEEGIVNVRASIGQASTDDPDFPAARLLGAADANMYKVKQATRNAEAFVPRQVTPNLRAVK